MNARPQEAAGAAPGLTRGALGVYHSILPYHYILYILREGSTPSVAHHHSAPFTTAKIGLAAAACQHRRLDGPTSAERGEPLAGGIVVSGAWGEAWCRPGATPPESPRADTHPKPQLVVRSSSRRAPVGTLRACRPRARSGFSGPGKREPHAPLGRFANASVALAACVGGISVAGRAGAPALCRRGIPAHPPAAHLPLPAGLLQHKVRRHCMTGGVLRVRSGRPADRRKAPCPGGRSRPIMATCRDSKPHSRGRAPTAGLRSTESDRRSESPCESRRASPPLAEPARQGHPPSSTTRLQLQRPSAVLWQASLFKLGLCSLVCLHHTMGLESATQALSETGRPPEENFLSWRGPPGSAPT